MNRILGVLVIAGLTISGALGFPPQERKNDAGEEFFIISSVNSSSSQLVLKRPTEVTLSMKVDDRTKYLDEKGKELKLADLRTGDTVWVLSPDSKDSMRVAVRIRKGAMTVAELHKLYLDFPPQK